MRKMQANDIGTFFHNITNIVNKFSKYNVTAPVVFKIGIFCSSSVYAPLRLESHFDF